jgi:hypothetical protein
MVSFLLTISLLSVSFSFSFDKNVKEKLNILYEATSVCEYYNTLTNLSYGIINKILESTKITLTEKTSQKDNTEKKEKENSNQNNLYFVNSTNEKEINSSKKINNYNFPSLNVFFNDNTGFNFLINNFVYRIYTFKLTCITLLLCYFARDNIDDININKIIKKVRLV